MGKSKHTKKRANGEGTIVKTDNGNYKARITLPDGTPHYHTFKEKNYEKALQLLDEYIKPFKVDSQIALEENLLAKVRTGKRLREIQQEQNATIAVSDIWTRFVEVDKKVRNAKPQTQAGYARYVRKLVNWLKEQGVTDIKKVTEEHALKFKELLFKEMCADSVKQRMNTYHWVWKSLGKVVRLKSNPWEGEDGDLYKVKVEESGHRRALRDDEVERIVGLLKDDDERLLFGLAIYLGQRISDCACFKKSYIDLQTNTVDFCQIKTNARVKKRIHPALRVLIDKVLAKGGDDDYIIPRFAKLWKNGGIFKYLNGIFTKAGIEVSRVVDDKRQVLTGSHAFRRWWSKKAAVNGMPMFFISKGLGHASEEMTKKYIDDDAMEAEGIINQFEDFFGNSSDKPTDADASLPQGVTAEEMKTLVEMLNVQKREGEGAVECLKRLVAGQKDEPPKTEEAVAVDVEPPLLNFKKAS